MDDEAEQLADLVNTPPARGRGESKIPVAELIRRRVAARLPFEVEKGLRTEDLRDVIRDAVRRQITGVVAEYLGRPAFREMVATVVAEILVRRA